MLKIFSHKIYLNKTRTGCFEKVVRKQRILVKNIYDKINSMSRINNKMVITDTYMENKR